MAKLTESVLRNIIKEELKKVIRESDDGYEIFTQKAPTGKTELSNDEIAVLAVIGQLESDGSDITQPAIQKYYRQVAIRSNGTVDSKKFKQSLMSLVNKEFVKNDRFGFSTTEAGDDELRNIGNHPVTKFLDRQ